MSDEELSNIDPSEAPTEVPNAVQAAAAAQPQKWKMPEPVFRQTSGYLPQGFEKRFPAPPVADVAAGDGGPPQPTEEPAEVPFDGNITMVAAAKARPAAPPPQIDPIEPQPELADTLTDFSDTISSGDMPAAPKKRRRGLRITLIVIGLLVAFAAISVFLAIVYFLFLLPSSEAGNF